MCRRDETTTTAVWPRVLRCVQIRARRATAAGPSPLALGGRPDTRPNDKGQSRAEFVLLVWAPQLAYCAPWESRRPNDIIARDPSRAPTCSQSLSCAIARYHTKPQEGLVRGATGVFLDGARTDTERRRKKLQKKVGRG